jgi:CRP-like cAMP-binding protein
MHIDYNILIAYGGISKKYDKGEYIYKEDIQPKSYFQIISGEVKVFSSNKNGKELIQGIYIEKHSFGEPALLLDKPYPNSAQTTIPSIILTLQKEKFIAIINDYPELKERMIYTFSERMYEQAAHAQILVSHTPEDKIALFLMKHKKKILKNNYSMNAIIIPYTRQQIADIIGLRVETVIRTIKRMKEMEKIKIINHKIYF